MVLLVLAITASIVVEEVQADVAGEPVLLSALRLDRRLAEGTLRATREARIDDLLAQKVAREEGLTVTPEDRATLWQAMLAQVGGEAVLNAELQRRRVERTQYQQSLERAMIKEKVRRHPMLAASRATDVWQLAATVNEELPPAFPTSPIARIELVGITMSSPERRVWLSLVGARVNEAKVAELVRAMWRRGDLEALRVELTQGVLRVSATPRRRVTRIRVDDGGSVPAVALLGAPFDPRLLAKAVEEVEFARREAGYTEARASVASQRTLPDETLAIELHVELGVRQVVRAIHVVGANTISEATIVGRLRTRNGELNAIGGAYNPSTLEMSLRQMVENEYVERGLLAARFATPQHRIDAATGAIDVDLRVDEGPVFRVRSVTIGGCIAEAKRAELLPLLATKPGQPADTLAADAARLRLQWKLDVDDVNVVTTIDPTKSVADFVIAVRKEPCAKQLR